MITVAELIEAFPMDKFKAELDVVVPVGARFLDLRGPEWIDAIELDRLNMGSINRCVLGHIGKSISRSQNNPINYAKFTYNPDFEGPTNFADGCLRPDYAASLVMTVEEARERGFTLPMAAFAATSAMYDLNQRLVSVENLAVAYCERGAIGELEGELWSYLNGLWAGEISARLAAREEKVKEERQKMLLKDLERVTIEVHRQQQELESAA